MTITPITDANPACYGVMCPEHQQCERYAMVESTTWHHTIGTCADTGSAVDRPLFLARVSDEVAA